METKKATVNTRLLADLAMLYIHDEELDSIRNDMESIIGFASQVSNTESEEETDVMEEDSRLREDICENFPNREKLLCVAPEKEDGFFKVTRVVE